MCKKLLSIILSISLLFICIASFSSSIFAADAFPDACITIPTEAQLFVGSKPSEIVDSGWGPYLQYSHFVSFDEIHPIDSVSENGNTTYYFDLDDDSVYNYRISSDSYITYGGTFKKTPDFDMTISEEMLSSGDKTKTSVDRNTSSNSSYNVADIYLNINHQGYLKMASVGDSYQLIPLRNWEAIDNTSNNYFIEPDFCYTVTDEDGIPCDNVISIDKDGVITAVGTGTAIVLVTYNSINLDFGDGKEFYGAIWPENTGVFVVSVGVGESGISPNMTLNEGLNNDTFKLSGDYIDAEHDVIYFIGDSGSYTFTPKTEGCSVQVANPTINTAMTFSGFEEVVPQNDSFDVPLTHGRNIVKIEKDGKSEYQIITAKKVNVTINNGDAVHAGDNLSIAFDTLYHPVGKLAGVYNTNAIALYKNVSKYTDKFVGGLTAQYNFADNVNSQKINNILKAKDEWGLVSYEKDYSLSVPLDYEGDTFTLYNGMFYVGGWGDPFGNHRRITLTDGKAPNLNADAKMAWLGKLPDIEIPISNAELVSMDIDTSNLQTEYYEGDTFNTENLVINATYEDAISQIKSGYTVSPEVISADTEYVTITYKDKTTQIPVSVTPLKVVSIEVTNPPSQTVYTKGSLFNPTGMQVTALYNNGKTALINNYSYAPTRELKLTDEQVIVTYSAGDLNEVLSTSTPITVVSAGSSSTPNNITVKFTLYGDDAHGEGSPKHTLKNGNLDTWIEKTSVTVPKGSCVADVISKALSTHGIPYSNPNEDYIESIRGLSELDNGAYSGWMYTINGKYSNRSISAQTVKSGDNIVFHYTDDYTVERDTTDSSSSSDTSSKKNNSSKNGTTTEKKTTAEKKVFSAKTFNDIKNDDWYYDSVKYVYENNLMDGTGSGFDPDTKMTRAMLVTVLSRLANAQNISKQHPFADVEEGVWYSDAVIWAAANGIIKGISDTEFAPNANITREQLAVIICRYAESCGYNTQDTASLSQFKDASDISDWAIHSIKWANKNGLIEGIDETTIAPQESATRAQTAAIIMRYCKNIK